MRIENIYELSFDLVQVAQIALFFIGIGILFLLKKNQNKNLYALIFAINFLLGISNSYGLKFTSLGLPNLYTLFALIAGPTLLFHVREYQMVGNASVKQYLKNVVPICFIGLIPLFRLPPDIRYILAVLTIMHFGIYLVFTVKALSYKKVIFIKDSGLSTKVLKKRWTFDFYFVIAVSFVYVTILIESFFTEIKMLYRISFVVMLLAGLGLFFSLFALRVREMYLYYEKNVKRKHELRYKNSTLSKEDSRKLYMKLKELMNKERIYLENEVTLSSTAAMLNTHPKLLSQAINENFGSNFFDYLNSHRIEQAKKMLLDPFYKEHRIYEIMYDVGFNSRSSFNTAFKKNTGMTARQFKNHMNNEEQ